VKEDIMKFDKFLEFVEDKVFSGFTLFLIFGGLFFYALISVAAQNIAAKEEARAITAACYTQGMVLVDTDAGRRCADPKSLVVVK